MNAGAPSLNLVMMWKKARVTLLGVALGAALPLQAHAPFRQMGEFYEGMAQPLLHVEPAVALAAMALLAGQAGAARARWHLGWLLVASVLSGTASLFLGWGQSGCSCSR